MGIFKCNHNWEIVKRSNVIQQDEIGYPLRLFICKCSKCGEISHQWIDVDESELRELETGESILLKWSDINLVEKKKSTDFKGKRANIVADWSDCSNMPNEEFELINNYLEQGKLPPLNLKSKGTKGIHVHKNGWT